MRIIACVHGDGDDGVALVAAVHRQIRPPEEVIVVVSSESSACDFTNYSRVTNVTTDSRPVLVGLLEAAMHRMSSMSPAEKYETAFMLAERTELRKDATDYLRKTYMPGRIVCFHTENAYLIAERLATRLDPSGVVLVPCRVLERLVSEWQQFSGLLSDMQGSRGVGFGWWCASKGIQTGAIGAAVRYARPLDGLDMNMVEMAGDHISNFWRAE